LCDDAWTLNWCRCVNGAAKQYLTLLAKGTVQRSCFS